MEGRSQATAGWRELVRAQRDQRPRGAGRGARDLPGRARRWGGDRHSSPVRVGDDELERLRIRAGTPRYGREIDDRVLPAEAGLEARTIDFEKGCYPGQEPIARQHYRGRVNRTLRVLALEGDAMPEYDAELVYDGKAVGRVTSTARDGESVVALAYVRREVPADVTLDVQGRAATQLDLASPRP